MSLLDGGSLAMWPQLDPLQFTKYLSAAASVCMCMCEREREREER